MKFTFPFFILWTSYYFVIESIHMHFIRLTMLLFTKLFWYKEGVVSLFTKNWTVVSMHILTIMTFWKAINHISLWGLWIKLQWGGGLAQARVRPRGAEEGSKVWGHQVHCIDRWLSSLNCKDSLLSFEFFFFKQVYLILLTKKHKLFALKIYFLEHAFQVFINSDKSQLIIIMIIMSLDFR